LKTVYRRGLGIVTLGGGFLGLTIGIATAVGPGMHPMSRLLILPFLVLYGWGIYCGLRMIEDPASSLRMNRTFWALQIPYLVSPIGGAYFFSGAYVLAAISSQAPEWRLAAKLGSEFQVTLLQADKPYAAGINLFAVGMVVFLTHQLRTDQRRAGAGTS